jgi:hypothetical protein
MLLSWDTATGGWVSRKAESNGVGCAAAPSRKAREGAHPQFISVNVERQTRVVLPVQVPPYLWLLLSLASPWGPSGRESTRIIILDGPEARSRLWSSIASNPNLRSSRINALLLAGFPGLPICTPVSSLAGGVFPSGIPAAMNSAPYGRILSQCAMCSAVAIVNANSSASISEPWNTITADCPANWLSRLASMDCWPFESRLHSTLSSIWTRANRSLSASLRNCSASFSFTEARSLASPAFCSAFPARSSYVCNELSR